MNKLQLIAGVILLSASTVSAADLGTEAQKATGKELYGKYCVQCHGEAGDGNGPGAAYFKPRPRDFTGGKYKIRTTGSGQLPTDQDIFHAIKEGLAFKQSGAYTVMPPWPYLSDDQIMNLVYYLKTFSPDFADPEYNNPKTISTGSPIASSEESIKKGRAVFENNECIKCHGQYGRSDGNSAPTLEDDWEHHIRPADLTKRWTFRGGGRKEDIFRTVTTGFNGTPMPAYADTVSEEDRWHLVNYIYSLSDRDTPDYNQADTPINAVYTDASIDMSSVEAAQKAFEGTTPAHIALVGQVIEPGREFHPGVNEVDVQAVYTSNDIAVMLAWNDMIADTSGVNSPDQDVPVFSGEQEVESDDPFGEEEEEEADPFAEEEEGSAYSDAVGVQIPLARAEPSTPFKKPYFIFGDSKLGVDLWYANLAEGAAKTYRGKGSSALTELGDAPLEAVAEYKDGRWVVIFKRPRTVEGSFSFDKEEEFVPVAFTVWDGFNEERGNKRGLTSWYSLYLSPSEKPSVILPMLGYGLGLLLLELIIIFLVRRRNQ